MNTLERVAAFATGTVAGAVIALLITGLVSGGHLYGSTWLIALGSVGIGTALWWWWVRARADASGSRSK